MNCRKFFVFASILNVANGKNIPSPRVNFRCQKVSEMIKESHFNGKVVTISDFYDIVMKQSNEKMKWSSFDQWVAKNEKEKGLKYLNIFQMIDKNWNGHMSKTEMEQFMNSCTFKEFKIFVLKIASKTF